MKAIEINCIHRNQNYNLQSISHMEKLITFSNIKASFLKDHDTFSKMDPFLIFIHGQTEQRTQTAHEAGKSPSFSKIISITYNPSHSTPQILIKAHEEDLVSNDILGQGILEINTLSNKGEVTVRLQDNDKQEIGTATLSYIVEEKLPSPEITLRNIKCFVKKPKKVSCRIKNKDTGDQSSTGELEGMNMSWKSEKLKVNFEKSHTLIVSVIEDGILILEEQINARQLQTIKGRRNFYLRDKNYEYIGRFSFDFETQHYLSLEQSNKMEEKLKEANEKLLKVKVSKIKGQVKSSEDIYFKINAGPIHLCTNYLENANKNFTLDVNKTFYLEKTEKSIIFTAFDKDVLSDDLLGIAKIKTSELTPGETKLKLIDHSGEHFGDISINFQVEEVVCRTIELSDIKLELRTSGDIVTKTEPYLIGYVGEWRSRTQILNGQKVEFLSNLLFKFSEEKELILQIWDEDVVVDDWMYTVTIDLCGMTEKGTMKLNLTPKNGKQENKSTISFSYNGSNISKGTTKKQFREQPKNQPTKKENIPSVKKFEHIQQSKQEPENKKPQHTIEQETKSQYEEASNNQGHISRSKSSFRYRIRAEKNKKYGDRIFPVQSSATLQKSILVYSMPKANRFRNGPAYQGEPSYYVDTCFKPNPRKGAGFGFGNKREFPEWMQRNMKQNPAPGAYFEHHQALNSFIPKGPSFGIAHHYYNKVTIPKQGKFRKQTERLRPLRH